MSPDQNLSANPGTAAPETNSAIPTPPTVPTTPDATAQVPPLPATAPTTPDFSALSNGGSTPVAELNNTVPLVTTSPDTANPALSPTLPATSAEVSSFTVPSSVTPGAPEAPVVPPAPTGGLELNTSPDAGNSLNLDGPPDTAVTLATPNTETINTNPVATPAGTPVGTDTAVTAPQTTNPEVTKPAKSWKNLFGLLNF